MGWLGFRITSDCRYQTPRCSVRSPLGFLGTRDAPSVYSELGHKHCIRNIRLCETDKINTTQQETEKNDNILSISMYLNMYKIKVVIFTLSTIVCRNETEHSLQNNYSTALLCSNISIPEIGCISKNIVH